MNKNMITLQSECPQTTNVLMKLCKQANSMAASASLGVFGSSFE